MAGKKFGALTALWPAGTCKSGDIVWAFVCSCGNEFSANGYSVRVGKVISCQECSKKRSREASVKHGMSNSSEFGIWTDIQTRCYNNHSTAYKYYGARGISMCDRWRRSFQNFLTDMGARPSSDHSVDRIDTNGNYEPSNCRWATRKEQANNKRNNVLISINGETKTMTTWCAQFNVSVAAVSLRYKKGIRGSALFEVMARKISFDGVTDTISGWSKKTGIKPTTLGMRLAKGWEISKALTKGASL